MGYDLHITRAKFHASNEGFEISANEWLSYVQSDPELRRVPDNGEYFVEWTGPSSRPQPWLDWFAGDIYTKAPNRPLLGKMLQIAQKLGARVQGDEGEFYTDVSEIPDIP